MKLQTTIVITKVKIKLCCATSTVILIVSTRGGKIPLYQNNQLVMIKYSTVYNISVY